MRGLPAKMSAPVRPNVVRRDRLFRRIDAAVGRSIVWIVGPPGAGKTTLAASYVRARRAGAIWYQIDSADGDAANLFYYLGLAAGTSELPTWSGDPAALPAFARRWFEALYLQLPASATLVFDDHHEAPAGSPWHVAFREGLGAVPAGTGVIVASRAAPPPELARLVASHQLVVIDADELRLAPEEARAIAKKLAPDGADRLPDLERLADGWAAGLVLLLAGRRRELGEALRGGPTHDIFNYFAAEAFDRLDDMTRRVLLATSFAPRIDDALAVQLAGELAPALLEVLARRGLFVERVPPAAHRCHALFRAFLRHRACETLTRDELGQLRRDTAAHLEQAGDSDDAFALYIDAGEIDAAAALLAREAPGLLAQQRAATLEARLGKLPPARVAGDASLVYWRAVLELGRAPTEAVRLFERAFDLARDPVVARLAWAGKVQAIVIEGEDFHQLDSWFDRCPSEPIELPPALALQLETARLVALQFRRPGARETRVAAERVHALFRAVRDVEQALVTGGMLLMYYVFADGHLGRAGEVLELLRSAMERPAATPLARMTWLVGASVYDLARLDAKLALERIDEAFSLAAEHGLAAWTDQAGAVGVTAALMLEDHATAQRFLETIAKTARGRGRFLLGNYHFYAAWEAFVRGDLARAEHGLEAALESADACGHAMARVTARIGYGQVAALTNRPQLARTLLREARELTDAFGSRFIEHGCSLAEVIEAQARGETDVRALLARGLGAAREGGFHNTHWLLREPTAAACALALEAGIETAHVRTLVRRLGLRPKTMPIEASAWPWRLELRTFGSFSLAIDGERVAHDGKPQRSPMRLLHALLAHGGRGVPERTLVDALWPEAEGDAGRRVFDTTLHRLRKLLVYPELLRLEERRLVLDDSAVWTDLWALERRLGELDATPVEHLPGAVERARAAIALYTGPFLADNEDDPSWVIAARDRLRARITAAVGRIVKRLSLTGSGAHAAELAAALTRSDPAIVLRV